MKFQKIDGTKIEFVDYVKKYINNFPDTRILIGCDSQNKSKSTNYVIAVALYHPGHGAHVIYDKWRTNKEKDITNRLYKEVCKSIETAEILKNSGINNIDYIDIDVNPNPKYKSNKIFNAAKSMVESMGYHVRFKSFGALVTSTADNIVRHY